MQPSILFQGQPAKVLNDLAVRRLAAINDAVRQARQHGVLLAVRAIHIDTDPPRAELLHGLPTDLLDLASSFLSQRQPDGRYRVHTKLFGIEWAWLSAHPLAHQSTTMTPLYISCGYEESAGRRRA